MRVRLKHEQGARRDGAHPGRPRPLAGRDGEMQHVRAAHPGREADRGTGRPPGGRRRHPDGVPAGVSRRGDRVRRLERSPQPRQRAESTAGAIQGARGNRHQAERELSHEGQERMTPSSQLARAASPSGGRLREWLDGDPALSEISDAVARPLNARPGPRWWACFGVSSAALAVGIGCVSYEVATGIGVWGLNRTVGWAFDITTFVFWIGIGHAGTLISAILMLFRQKWRTSINRSAEAMTIFAVMCAALFPLIHMGRPWMAFWVMPYPNARGPLWVNFRSPLLWDVFAFSTYLTIAVVCCD